MEATIYSLDGKKSSTIDLSEAVFGVRWNADLVKQVADSLLSKKRKSIAHTKGRGDVRGGGKKPWQQKGTGRARHGSTRSPIWVGGGITGGPTKDKNFERKVSKKMRIKALHTLLSRKLKDGEVFFVDSITLAEPKTKEAIKALRSLSNIKGLEGVLTKKNNSALVALSKKDRNIEQAFDNIGNIKVIEARNLDPISLLQYKYFIVENPKAIYAKA